MQNGNRYPTSLTSTKSAKTRRTEKRVQELLREHLGPVSKRGRRSCSEAPKTSRYVNRFSVSFYINFANIPTFQFFQKFEVENFFFRYQLKSVLEILNSISSPLI